MHLLWEVNVALRVHELGAAHTYCLALVINMLYESQK